MLWFSQAASVFMHGLYYIQLYLLIKNGKEKHFRPQNKNNFRNGEGAGNI